MELKDTIWTHVLFPKNFLEEWDDEAIGRYIRGLFAYREEERRESFRKMCKSVKVNGKVYSSKAEAMRILGVSRSSLKGKEV